MLVNRIGPYFFLEIRGVPETVKQQLELAVRPGVDGVAIWETGRRGKPFQLETRVDMPNLGQAVLAYGDYATLADRDPVGIIWRGLDFTLRGLLHQVLEVEAVELTWLANSSGGLNPPSLAMCHCRWTLLPVLGPPPDPDL